MYSIHTFGNTVYLTVINEAHSLGPNPNLFDSSGTPDGFGY